MKILVVDDDESILALLDQFLGGYCGYEVVTSLCGLRALELIMRAQKAFDCFLIDIQMPGVDGIELCRKIREIGKHQSTPITMLTAMTDLNFVDRAFSAGADDYVTKPFEFAELRARLENSQSLMREQETEEAQSEQRVEIFGADEMPPAIPFSEAINICGVQGVLGTAPFENYIMQMSRIGEYGSSIFAVQITNAKSAFDRCSPDQFHEIVRLVAKMIIETLEQHGGFTSYFGSGVFLCIQNGRDILSDDQIRSALNRKLHVRQLSVGRRTRLYVGQQYSVGWVTKPNALEVLSDANQKGATILRADAGPKLLPEIPKPGDFAGREDGELELHAYEALVKNLLNTTELQSEHRRAWNDMKAS